jgi:hypothetical protein
VDKAVLMEFAQRGRQPNSDVQKLRKLHATLKNPIEGLATQVLEDQHCPPLVANERKR